MPPLLRLSNYTDGPFVPPNVVTPPPPPPPTNHEPSGMTTVINTGIMDVAPTNTNWVQNGYKFSNFTGSGAGTKIQLAPEGHGIAILYDTALSGGNNYITWGSGGVGGLFPELNGGGPEVGVWYSRMNIRFRGPNTSTPYNFIGRTGQIIRGVKLFEPRCGTAPYGTNNVENHVGASNTTNSDHFGTEVYALGVLQCNCTGCGCFTQDYVRFDQQTGSPPSYQGVEQLIPKAKMFAYLQQYVTVEFIYVMETTPGVSGDAYIVYYVNNALAYDSRITGAQSGTGGTWLNQGNFNMLAVGDLKAWTFLTFNQTFGGAPSAADGPAQTQYLDTDYIYVSKK